MAQLGSAFAWGVKGRTFESCRPDQIFFSMKVVFDIGKVLATAHMMWREALQASKLPYVENDLVNGQLYDFAPYLPYEGGQISEDEYLSKLSDQFQLGGIENARFLHQSIIGDEYPGVAEIVDELHSLGIETATLSNNNPIHWAWFTESGNYPAIEKIQHPIASFHLGLFKPDPLIFPKFCEFIGWDREELVFLDDSEKNVMAAMAAGWTAFQILDDEPKATQIRRLLDLS